VWPEGVIHSDCVDVGLFDCDKDQDKEEERVGDPESDRASVHVGDMECDLRDRDRVGDADGFEALFVAVSVPEICWVRVQVTVSVSVPRLGVTLLLQLNEKPGVSVRVSVGELVRGLGLRETVIVWENDGGDAVMDFEWPGDGEEVGVGDNVLVLVFDGWAVAVLEVVWV